jgi:hypothetical protein
MLVRWLSHLTADNLTDKVGYLYRDFEYPDSDDPYRKFQDVLYGVAHSMTMLTFRELPLKRKKIGGAQFMYQATLYSDQIDIGSTVSAIINICWNWLKIRE